MSRNLVVATPLSRDLGSRGHTLDRAIILSLVKPKTSVSSTQPRPKGGERDRPSRRTAGSLLAITMLGAIAVAIAVFGRPTQAVAAAVIVVALCALAQGRSVTRSTTSAIRTLVRALQGPNTEVRIWPPYSQGDLPGVQPSRHQTPRNLAAPERAQPQPSRGRKSRFK